MRLAAEVSRRCAVRFRQVPLVDPERLVSALDHEPMHRAGFNDPANLALKLSQGAHSPEVVLSPVPELYLSYGVGTGAFASLPEPCRRVPEQSEGQTAQFTKPEPDPTLPLRNSQLPRLPLRGKTLRKSPPRREPVKDLYAVLIQKENDIRRLRREIEALRFILPLLADDAAPPMETPPPLTNKWPLEISSSR